MTILIIDPSERDRGHMISALNEAGYPEVSGTASFGEALKLLEQQMASRRGEGLAIILMALELPDMSGIQACMKLKEAASYRDVLVILLGTDHAHGVDADGLLETGTVDMMRKPVDRVELLARVRSAMRLKAEMNRRKLREQELAAASKRLWESHELLQQLSSYDTVTGLANRKAFEDIYQKEWKRAVREEKPLSLIMAGVDRFDGYVEAHGVPAGDECLKRTAQALKSVLRRPGDLLARYGEAEFVAVLPGTHFDGVELVGRAMQEKILGLKIPYRASPLDQRMTVSVGVVTALPRQDLTPGALLAGADLALFEAKVHGVNQLGKQEIL